MTEQPQMTQEQIYEKLEQEWDFEKLIEPYREGGTLENPVRRSWGTIIDWLVNRHKFPIEVAGSAIFLVWAKIKKDGHFPGDGTYGSAGNQFVQSIRIMCASIMQEKVSTKIFTGMAGEIEDRLKVVYKADLWTNMPWWVKVMSVQYWKFRKQQKLANPQEKSSGWPLAIGFILAFLSAIVLSVILGYYTPQIVEFFRGL